LIAVAIQISSNVASSVLLSICAVIYILLFLFFKFHGGFTSDKLTNFFVSMCIIGFLGCFIYISFIFLSIRANSIYFFVLLVSLIVGYFVSFLITNRFNQKQVVLLDSIESDPDNIYSLSSSSKFFSTILAVFHADHPICYSLNIFKLALERFARPHANSDFICQVSCHSSTRIQT
jgi:glucan phosphoethanolaminetransferase (alkaline phosphatase superfamily)